MLHLARRSEKRQNATSSGCDSRRCKVREFLTLSAGVIFRHLRSELAAEALSSKSGLSIVLGNWAGGAGTRDKFGCAEPVRPAVISDNGQTNAMAVIRRVDRLAANLPAPEALQKFLAAT